MVLDREIEMGGLVSRSLVDKYLLLFDILTTTKVVRCYTTLSLPWGWKELYRFIDLYIYILRPVGENGCLIGRDAMEKRRGLVGGA